MTETHDLDHCISDIFTKLGKKIVIGAPLGVGKPNILLNAIYQKAKKDPSIDLHICTALTLEKPKAQSELEKRFLEPFVQRVFADYPDLDYELDRKTEKLPSNIKIIEFYYPPGKFLNNNRAQQNYLSSNYTHVCRDMIDRGVNLLVQMVARDGDYLSLSSNADVTTDLLSAMKKESYPSMAIAMVNQNLPFMYGDALIHQTEFDILIDNKNHYYQIFGPPKMKVSDADYMIGLYASSLVKDDGELQVGIGSLGDAVIYGLLMRQKENELYKEILEETGFLSRFSKLISRLGDLEIFQKGLFGATEMMVDGFMELFEHNILKKKVYDHIGLQRLINEGSLNPQNLPSNLLDLLKEKGLVGDPLTKKDHEFLKYWGISYDGKTIEKELLHGHLMHAGFFLGPQKFYNWLRDLPVEKRKLFSMKSVQKINQLYGHEEIDRLHRKNARFINTCMMTTLSGAHVSDGLESGQVVSGVGGQFNFVAMAQELPDGHSILSMRATKEKNGKVLSNIIHHYGHTTVPRHMRDILVTEYGVAFLRGKTDQEIIEELLKVCDSRFQESLINQAKASGKLSKDYSLPKAYQNNFPEGYRKILSRYKAKGHFKPFPFGTDLTEDEILLGAALTRLKAKREGSLFQLVLGILRSKPITDQRLRLLKRLELHNSQNLKEKLLRRLVLSEL